MPGPSRDRKAQGHQGARPVPDWRMGALAAAGALYSTSADLARFLQACLAAAVPASPDPGRPGPARPDPDSPGRDGPLAPAIRATLTPRQPIPRGEIGLAWHQARHGDRRIIWHNGMTGGFSAMIAFDPGRRLGVAALASSACRPPSPLDQAVLRAFSP